MEENKCKTKVQKPCGPTKEKKNVVDLMKMVKKSVGPHRGQKKEKRK
jgi:non-homologous end joining protein Ku